MNRLREIRKAQGLTQQELAEMVGTSYVQIGRLEKGERQLTVDWLKRLAGALNVRPWDIVEEALPDDFDIPILGYVGAGATVYPCSDYEQCGGFDRVTVPRTLGHNLAGVVVSGTSMMPVYRDGDILIYRPTSDLRASLMKEAIVWCADGRVYLKFLRPGRRPGHFTLVSYNAEVMDNVEIEKAAPVIWVKKAEAQFCNG